MAPLAGGAVPSGGDVPPAAATQCVAGPASRPCGRCGKGGPKSAAEATGLPQQFGSYSNIRVVLRHFGRGLSTEQRGSGELNVCPWSKLEGAGHCTWWAGKHLRPSRFHPKDLLDHMAKDHGLDPGQREQAEAMIKGVALGGVAGGPRGGQGWNEGARVARGSPSLGNTRSVIVGDVEWTLRVCSGDFNKEHGSRHGFGSQRGPADLCSVPWSAPGGDFLSGWAAEVGVRSGCGIVAPAAYTRCRRPSSFQRTRPCS